jgi:hypothetical protein
MKMHAGPRARLALVVVALALSPVVAAAPADPVSACAGLDAQGRAAMQWFINGAFPVPSRWVECREDNGVNAKTLRRESSAAVPCLVQIYRTGLAHTGLWLRSGPPPRDGGWALGVLGQVDPPAAIGLWREKASAEKDQWKRLGDLFQAGSLGDSTVLADLARGLAAPPAAPGWKASDRDGFLSQIADLMAQYNYRPALPAIERLNNPPHSAFQWLYLHILQLEGDVETLESRTRDKDAAGAFAVRALYRMNARDVLSRVAADPNHPRREDARFYLGLNLRL